MRTTATFALALGLAGCAVTGTVPVGGIITPPAVVVQPPVYHWHWGAWPHYDVVHEYVVDEQPVVVRHHHYYPFYDRVHPGPHDHGKHKGWFKHGHDRDDD